MSTLALNTPELQTKLFGLGAGMESVPAESKSISELANFVMKLCMEPDVEGKDKAFGGNRLVRFLGDRASRGLTLVYDRRRDNSEMISQELFVDVHGLERGSFELDEELEGVQPGRYIKVDDLMVTSSHEALAVRSLVDPVTKDTLLRVAKPATEHEVQYAIDALLDGISQEQEERESDEAA